MTTAIAMFNPQTLELTEDAYLGGLLQLSENHDIICNGKIGSLIKDIRQKAANTVVKSSFPTTKDESWRFTDLSTLVKQDFRLATKVQIDSPTLTPFLLSEATSSRLVFINGYYAPESSDISSLPDGVYVGNLSNLPPEVAEKLNRYLAQTPDNEEVFTALNSSGITDVAFVYVTKNVEVTTPIHFLHLTVRDDYASFAQPRILVVAETNSSLQLIEYYGAVAVGCSDTARQQHYFNNIVTEIFLEDGAKIQHTRIQRESGDGFHIAKTEVTQSRNSHYQINEVSLGAKLYRHNLNIYQIGEQTETYLNGLTMTQGKQVADTHSQVNLTKPHGIVNQLHKCILDDNSQGIFNGKISVPKYAQLTNAAQLNRNLLLSPKARINTKPELQITADNVKCSHGATVSQLDPDEIFYLRSRGLNDYSAKHLLIDAFAAEILAHIPFKSLHHRLTQCVACRTLD